MDKKDNNLRDDNLKDNNLQDNNLNEKQDEAKQIEEEMAKMIKEMENYLGSDISNVKIVTIDKKQKRKFLYFYIFEIILSIVLLFASIGYLDWVECEKLYQYFILIGGVVLLEYTFKYLIKKFALKIMIVSFGTIMLLAPIASFIICLCFTPEVEILNYGALFFAFCAYLLIKKIFMTFLIGKGSNFIGGIKI